MVHAFIIEPKTYSAFEDEAEQIDKCKEWGLLSEKASKTKSFFYKGNGMNLSCTIVGYVDDMAAVIQLDNNQLHCIHPSYLKEMQASSYGQRTLASTDKPAAREDAATEIKARVAPVATETIESKESKAAEPPKEKPKKAKAQKLELPEEKVKMSAKVKEFATVPNHFSDNDDEVIIYEEVVITEPQTEVGTAWSSHSATIKKLELAIGDTITFEAKIAAKKLTKHPVPYKINNPSKITKVDA
ncbi:hypothetical protein [Paenibacillus sp. sgz302251]|uniref:hypothetical protein n=1 Tax=Paenibacillus sp. sgz302251 TaxID=3414493 RepID=UPI003C7AEE3F